MKKLILCITVITAIFWGQHYTSSQAAPQEQAIIVGTNAEYPPYAYIDQDHLVGFDIDIAEEICQRLGKTMTLKDMPFDALIPSLELKRMDFVAAGLTCTDERAERVLFTKPYLSGDDLVIVSATGNTITTLQDLQGKSIIVNEGYTADLYLSTIDGVTLVRLPAPADAFIALMSGRGDAFVTAQSTIQTFIKNNNQYHIAPIGNSPDGCSIALNKSSPLLLEKIQEALNTMEADGTIAQLKKKWTL